MKHTDKFQIYRTHVCKRINQAWWNIDQLENGSWQVHFHADFVPSTDWSAETFYELFRKVETEMVNWVAAVENYYNKA